MQVKIGVIIPDRGDRPRFIDHCMHMLQAQTLQPDEVLWMNYAPESDQCDITQRYRRGYDHFRGKGFDVLLFIENDDWYSNTYLETMTRAWVEAGKPEIFGTDHTTYYHIMRFSHFTMRHPRKSVAMSTMIRPDMHFNWCPDWEAYTDSHLWFVSVHTATGKRLKGLTFKPTTPICLGIKHGVGKTGGQTHTTELYRYTQKDPDRSFLKSIVDPESFDFYSNYFNPNHAETKKQIQAHS